MRSEGQPERPPELMRPIAWLLVLAGLWSVGHGLFAHEPVGTVGVIIVLIGWALLTARGRAILFWIGQGVLTGLCLLTGLALAAFGGLLLLRYVEVVSASVRLTVRSALIPTLFLGSGLLLLVIGAHRLWRERGPLP